MVHFWSTNSGHVSNSLSSLSPPSWTCGAPRHDLWQRRGGARRHHTGEAQSRAAGSPARWAAVRRAGTAAHARASGAPTGPPDVMAFLGQVADTWQALIDLIIRPPRHEYSVQRELGTQRLVVKGALVIREDIEVRDADAAAASSLSTTPPGRRVLDAAARRQTVCVRAVRACVCTVRAYASAASAAAAGAPLSCAAVAAATGD